MLANKIFVDIYSTSGGTMDYKKYREYYKKNNVVYIALIDSGIYCQVTREKMFDMNLHCGCFIETLPQNNPYQVEREIKQLATKYKLRQVSPSVFQYIEKQNEDKRVKRAFEYAEKLIASN